MRMHIFCFPEPHNRLDQRREVLFAVQIAFALAFVRKTTKMGVFGLVMIDFKRALFPTLGFITVGFISPKIFSHSTH